MLISRMKCRLRPPDDAAVCVAGGRCAQKQNHDCAGDPAPEADPPPSRPGVDFNLQRRRSDKCKEATETQTAAHRLANDCSLVSYYLAQIVPNIEKNPDDAESFGCRETSRRPRIARTKGKFSTL